ncbi:MAG: lysostaphin resistance A-like protein [Chitinophagales bacterium]
MENISEMENNELDNQYSIKKILTIWASVTLPMGFFAWILVPFIHPYFGIHPGLLYWIFMVIGMIWQFLVSVYLLKKELKVLKWEGIKKRIWANRPINSRTQKIQKRLFLWTIPVILYTYLIESSGIFDFVTKGVEKVCPFFTPQWYTNFQELAKPEFVGQWWILGLAVVSTVFNYVLGEELLFRGILLPRMSKAFGKWDWAVNGVLFATYHIHKFTEIPVFIIGDVLLPLSVKKTRSFWMGVIIHGVEAIPVYIGVLMVLTGHI